MAKRPVPKYDFKAFGAAFKVLFHVKGVLRVCVKGILFSNTGSVYGFMSSAVPHVKRFVKCFFELVTENFSARRETGQEKGRKTRLWTFRSCFRGWVV